MAVRAAVHVAFVLAAGCSRFDAAGDAGILDVDAGGTEPAESGTGDAAGSGSPPFDGQYEGPGPNCGPGWVASNASLKYGSPRTGNQSCRVCENSGATGTAIDIALHLSAPWQVNDASSTIIASAAIRFVGADAGVATTALHFWTYDSDAKLITMIGTDGHALQSGWQVLPFQAGLPTGTKTFDMFIGAEVGAGNCVEIDDVSLKLVP
jgi:hypothetical protein